MYRYPRFLSALAKCRIDSTKAQLYCDDGLSVTRPRKPPRFRWNLDGSTWKLTVTKPARFLEDDSSIRAL